MSKKRRQHSPEFKARVGLEALKGLEPVHAIAAKYKVHPVQVTQWKKEVLKRLPEVFAKKAPAGESEGEVRWTPSVGQRIGKNKLDFREGVQGEGRSSSPAAPPVCV